MNNVFAAIQNRDAGAMARMMGPDNHHDQQENVVNISAERLVDALFKQLKQLFPAAEQTNLKTVQQETDAKRQWIAAFAEGGIPAREGGRTHQVAPARQRIFLRLYNYLAGNKICA